MFSLFLVYVKAYTNQNDRSHHIPINACIVRAVRW